MLYFSKIPRTQKTMNNEEEVMNIKISKISFQGEARVIGSINGTKVPDEPETKGRTGQSVPASESGQVNKGIE